MSRLQSSWAVYFHDPNDEKWDENSYRKVATFETVEEWAAIHAAFADLWARGMFFVMREPILPMWEDARNRNGGCFSFKIMKPEIPNGWYNIVSRMVGENIMRDATMWENICGLAITPKRNYCVLRLWIADARRCHFDQYQLQIPSYSSVLFKPHQENKEYHGAAQ